MLWSQSGANRLGHKESAQIRDTEHRSRAREAIHTQSPNHILRPNLDNSRPPAKITSNRWSAQQSTNNCHNCDSIAANSVATPSIISRSRTLTSNLDGLLSDRLDSTGVVSWSQIRTNCKHHVLLPAIKWTVSQPQQLGANSPNCPKIRVNPTIRQESSKESCNSS